MTVTDLIVFFIYILGITIFGGSFIRKNKSSSSFTLGNNSVPAWVITMSIFATFVSSISFLALPGSAFLTNWNALAFSLSIPFALIIAVKYFVPLYRKINSPSAYTFLENRFGPWARIYVSSCYLLTQFMRIGTILYLLAITIHTAFGWNIIIIIVLTGLLVMVYSIMGGFQAVVWTDAIQGIVLIAGALVALIYILFAMPQGPVQVFSMANKYHKFSLGSFSLSLSQPTFWVVFVYGLFINLQNYGIDQNYVQKYIASKSERAAKRSAFWGGLIYVPVSLLFLFIGTALFSFYSSGAAHLPLKLLHSDKSDQVFPYFIITQLPTGITGLLIAAIFSAGMSTISTSFNSSATVFLTDYYKRYSKEAVSEKKSMRILYLSTFIISLAGIVVAIAMINVKSVLDTWWKLASVFSGGMLGLFLLGAFTRIAKSFGAIVGVIVGVLLIAWLTIFPMLYGKNSVASLFHNYLAIVFSTVAIFFIGFLISIFFRKKNEFNNV